MYDIYHVNCNLQTGRSAEIGTFLANSFERLTEDRILVYLSRLMTKPTKWQVRAASESSLSA